MIFFQGFLPLQSVFCTAISQVSSSQWNIKELCFYVFNAILKKTLRLFKTESIFSLILKWKSSFFLIKYVQVLSYAFNERGKDLNQFDTKVLGLKWISLSMNKLL